MPFKLSAQDVTQEKLDQVAEALNSTPRKILGFRTPFEVQNGIRSPQVLGESRVKIACPAIEGIFKADKLKLFGVALRY